MSDQVIRPIAEPPAGPVSREDLIGMISGAHAILAGLTTPLGAAYRATLLPRMREALDRERAVAREPGIRECVVVIGAQVQHLSRLGGHTALLRTRTASIYLDREAVRRAWLALGEQVPR